MGCGALGMLLAMKEVGKRVRGLTWVRAAGPVSAVIIGTVLVKMARPEFIKVVSQLNPLIGSFFFWFFFQLSAHDFYDA